MAEKLAQLEKKGGGENNFTTIATTTANVLRACVIEMKGDVIRSMVGDAYSISFYGNLVNVTSVSSTTFRITFNTKCTMYASYEGTVTDYNANDTLTISGGGKGYVILPR